MPQPKQEADQTDPTGPAIVTGAHVQDRILHTRAGAKAGWSKLTVFEQTHRGGKLICKDRCKGDNATQAEIGRALDRYIAGKQFTELWLISQASIGGSMDFSRIRAAGTGVPFTETQFEAKTKLRAIEKALGANDWMICRRVLGENYAVAETIVAIQPGYKFSTLARFRETLDALSKVLASIR